jgi:hypothetical protein
MAGRTRGDGVISWLCACINFAVRLICSHLSLEIDTREYNRGAEVSLFDCGFCLARCMKLSHYRLLFRTFDRRPRVYALHKVAENAVARETKM